MPPDFGIIFLIFLFLRTFGFLLTSELVSYLYYKVELVDVDLNYFPLTGNYKEIRSLPLIY